MYRNLDFNSLENEIWKPIKNYENMYQVSNLGRIKTLISEKIDKRGRKYKKTPKIMKQSFTSTGYLMVNLNKKMHKVHRLVAQAFIIKPLNKDIVNHKDFNPLNNKVDNLEWVTQKENVEYSILNKIGNIKYFFDKEKVKEMFLKGVSMIDIAKQLNIPKYSIASYLTINHIHRKIGDRIGKYNVTPNIIRKMLKSGENIKNISKKYNIPTNYISVIKYKMKLKGEI